MDYSKYYKIITIEELFSTICDMEYIDEIAFTPDNNLEQEPSGWYGIRKINLFDNDYYVVGYYGGNFLLTFDVGDFNFEEFNQSILSSVYDFDGKHICIDLGTDE